MGITIFLMWIVLSILAGAIGSNKTCGFAGAFFASIILSPLVGLIIVFASNETKECIKKRITQEESIRLNVRQELLFEMGVGPKPIEIEIKSDPTQYVHKELTLEESTQAQKDGKRIVTIIFVIIVCISIFFLIF